VASWRRPSRSHATSFYEQDGLGSVTSLSNAGGALAQSYTFDSFGKQTGSTGSLTNPFQYTARESDPETGLYYYRARYYDPTVGRFLSEDPIGFDGGNDFYAYVKNSPVVRTDPLGLAECWYTTMAHYLYCSSNSGDQFSTYGARSGRGLCRNNPDCIKTHDQGPIPPGTYGMGPMGGTPNPHNPPRVFLTPLSGTVTFNRGSIEIHQGGNNSSAGCIVLDPNEYQRFRIFYEKDNSGTLHVP
jgi:RHS repeat-associated protein